MEICHELDKLGSKFMVSYDDRKEILNSFEKYNIVKIPIRYSGQLFNKDYKNELVITNYKPSSIQESLF